MPTFVHGKAAKAYLVDSGATERDISNTVTEVQLPITADAAEVTALGDAAKNNIAGLKDSTISITCTRDATVEGYFFGVLGATTTYAYCPEGSATGKIKYSGTIVVTGLSETSNLSGATTATLTGQGAGTVTRTVLP